MSSSLEALLNSSRLVHNVAFDLRRFCQVFGGLKSNKMGKEVEYL